VLGDRGITVALDDVHLDATFVEFGDVHVARRSRAQENDVLEFRTLRDQRCRHVRMVVDCDAVAADDARQFITGECLTVDIDGGIVRPDNALPNGSKLVVAVEENSFHRNLARA